MLAMSADRFESHSTAAFAFITTKADRPHPPTFPPPQFRDNIIIAALLHDDIAKDDCL
jgi:hypothetical protein